MRPLSGARAESSGVDVVTGGGGGRRDMEVVYGMPNGYLTIEEHILIHMTK